MTEAFPNLRGLILCLLAALYAGGSGAIAQEPDCGGLDRPIVFAELDYDSAQLHNAIARHILETGYGCSTEAIPGSTVPMLQGVIRGDIDVVMEIYTNNPPEFWGPALEAGSVVELGVNFPDAVEGWFVPRYLVEGDPERGIDPAAPGLRSVADLPDYYQLFEDPEQPQKGRFYNCIIGWVCEEINTAKLEAYGLNPYFTNFRPGTGVALAASMEAAYLRGEPWVGYYWGPTWVLGKLDMFRLEEPEYSDECWDELTDGTPPVGEGCAYPLAQVNIAANARFVEEVDPAITEFLRDYETSNDLVSELLAYMQETEETPEAAALHFLENYRDTWSGWVPEEVAARVADSL